MKTSVLSLLLKRVVVINICKCALPFKTTAMQSLISCQITMGIVDSWGRNKRPASLWVCVCVHTVQTHS